MPLRASALDEELAPPTLNRFELLAQLARGGMAEVFLTRATGIAGFERLLVIKRILPELASDTEFVRMLLDEARNAATLHHQNIVQVHEVGVADGQVFYAMEYLHGHDVTTIVRRLTELGTRMPLGNAIAITAAVASGLHYAHERCGTTGQPLDIVHRDVGPSNVIVTYDGNVKLIDFGIAKAANNLSRTKFGLFKGKLPYASPEQCRCEPIDRRTDVFSLGVLLYELTTGERLFTADNEYDLLHVVSEAVVPRPRLRDKAFPRALEAIVVKALARDRDDRHQTALELQLDLEAFASNMQLDRSSLSLSRLMESLFADHVLLWRSAERAGISLEKHIIATAERSSVDGRDVDRSAADAAPIARAASAPRYAAAIERRSQIMRFALIAAAVLLVGASALGRWLTSPDAETSPEAQPSAPRSEPRPPAAPAPSALEVAPSRGVAPLAATPDPAIEIDRAPSPRPPRKAKRGRTRLSNAARSPAAEEATAPRSQNAPESAPPGPAISVPHTQSKPAAFPSPPPFDEATLDEVAPRSGHTP